MESIQTSNEADDLLTVQQVAKMLNITEGAIRTALSENRLPFTEKYGRKLIARADVLAYQQRTRISGDKPKGRPKGSGNVKKNGETEADEQAGTERKAGGHD